MKPKIAFVTHSAEMGGAEIFLSRILPKLKAFDCRVYFIGNEGPMLAHMNSLGIEVKHLKISASILNIRTNQGIRKLKLRSTFRSFISDCKLLSKEFVDYGASLVYTNSSKAHIVAAIAGRLGRVPVISHMHDALRGGNFSRLNFLTLWLCLRIFATQVIVNSNFTNERLGSRWWRSSPVVVDCALPDWSPPVARHFTQSKPLIFGTVGRITRWKGQDNVIRAYSEIRKVAAFSNSKLLVVGSPSLPDDFIFEAELRQQVSDLGLASFVEFLSYTPDIEIVYGQLDVLLHHPKTPEPFGQVLLEAQSRGTIVFAPLPGGATEFISSGINGFLFEIDGSLGEFLVESLSAMLPAGLAAVSREGLSTSKGRFSANLIADQLTGLFDFLLRSHKNQWSRYPIHVAHLDHTSDRGGAEYALVRTLSLQPDWEPRLFVPAQSGVFRPSFQILGRRVFVDTKWFSLSLRRGERLVFSNILKSIIASISTAREFRRHPEFKNCDLIHANSTRSLLVACLAKTKRQRVIFHLRDDINNISKANFLFKCLVKLIIKLRVSGVIANSNFTLRRLGKIPPEVLVRVITSPIGQKPGYSQKPTSRIASKDDGRIVVCMLARLTPWKGQELLIASFAKLLQTGRKVELWLVGSGDLETTNFAQAISDRCLGLGISEFVKILGHIDDVTSLLRDVDICVQYSTRPEPMGQNVLQYLAAGKTIIVAGEGGPIEWITHGQNGIVVPPRNEAALLDALVMLCDDENLRNLLATSAAQTLPENYDLAVVSQLGDFFTYVLDHQQISKRSSHFG